MSVESGLGKTAQACRAMGLNRSLYYKVSQESAHRLRAKDVIDTVEEMIVEHGRPEHIRSDNGP